MWKNVVKLDRPQMTIWHMHIACWIPKATNTHSEYVILIAFPLQQWLDDRASALAIRILPVLVLLSAIRYSIPHSLRPSFLVLYSLSPEICLSNRLYVNIQFIPSRKHVLSITKNRCVILCTG